MSDSVCPQQIVQVASNALALGDLCQMLDLLVRLAQLFPAQ